MFKNIFGHYYVLIVFTFITIIYYVNMAQVWMPQYSAKPKATIMYLVMFNFLTFMVIWCLVKTMISDPGKVPRYWGFFLDDPEQKKRRYCLICHIFKPERCHHCSACNRCVLNMDHHCPWINNCVGFQNRKFFLLLIIYVNLDLIYIITGMIPTILDLIQNYEQFQLQKVIIVIPFLMMFTLLILIANFLNFHIRLATSNMTTIENLEHQKQQNFEEAQLGKYDQGFYKNWIQIFGKNIWLWPIPIFGESGKPDGDGVNWVLKQQEVTLKDNFQGNGVVGTAGAVADEEGTGNTEKSQQKINLSEQPQKNNNQQFNNTHVMTQVDKNSTNKIQQQNLNSTIQSEKNYKMNFNLNNTNLNKLANINTNPFNQTQPQRQIQQGTQQFSQVQAQQVQ